MIKQIRSIWRLVYGLVTCGVLAAFCAHLGVEWEGFGQVLRKGLGASECKIPTVRVRMILVAGGER